MNILEYRDVHISYRDREAVNNVTLPVPAEKITVLAGESGSGKSTLLRAAAGLLPSGGRLTAGQILYQGQDLAGFSKDRLRQMHGSEMAVVFQNAGVYLNPRRKIGGQFLEMLLAHGKASKKEMENLAKETLRRLHLPDVERIWKAYPFQLSGGMQQRVAIAMAISMRPKILLADEPTSALDVTVQAQVVQELLRLKKELHMAILLVTHNMGVASKMADRIAVMKNGQIVEAGSRDQIIFYPKNPYTKALLEAVPKLESEESIAERREEHKKSYRLAHGEKNTWSKY